MRLVFKMVMHLYIFICRYVHAHIYLMCYTRLSAGYFCQWHLSFLTKSAINGSLYHFDSTTNAFIFIGLESWDHSSFLESWLSVLCGSYLGAAWSATDFFPFAWVRFSLTKYLRHLYIECWSYSNKVFYIQVTMSLSQVLHWNLKDHYFFKRVLLFRDASFRFIRLLRITYVCCNPFCFVVYFSMSFWVLMGGTCNFKLHSSLNHFGKSYVS